MEHQYGYPAAVSQVCTQRGISVVETPQVEAKDSPIVATQRECERLEPLVLYRRRSAAVNRAIVVYEPCLDVLFHCISCKKCNSPTQNIAKFVDNDSLLVKVYCSSGHQLLHWSSHSTECIQIQRTVSVNPAKILGVNSVKESIARNVPLESNGRDESLLDNGKAQSQTLEHRNQSLEVDGNDRLVSRDGVSGDLSCDTKNTKNHKEAERGDTIIAAPILIKVEDDDEFPSDCSQENKQGPESSPLHTSPQPANNVHSDDAIAEGSTVSNLPQSLDGEVEMNHTMNQVLHGELAPGSKEQIGDNSGQQPIAFTERIRTATMCRFCCKVFPLPSELDSHERSHTGERPYECRYCSKGFAHWSHVKSHELTHTGFRAFACCFCDKRFPLSTQCRAHERTHVMRPSSVNATSPIIPSSSGSSAFFKTNSTEEPESKTMDKATHTEFGKTRSSNHPSPATQPLPSRRKTTYSRKFYSSDVPFIPTALQPNILCCQFCGKQLSSMECRKLHERIHTGEKPYKCSYCSKMFADKSVCRIHERIHTGDRPYTCRFCGRKFSQSSHCRGHERTHTGEMPYKCQYCGQSFRYKTSQRNHERLHVSESLSTCKVCQRIFRNEEDCRIHEKKHHACLISMKNGVSSTINIEARFREDSADVDEMSQRQDAGSKNDEEQNIDGSVSFEETAGKESSLETVSHMIDDSKHSDAVTQAEEDQLAGPSCSAPSDITTPTSGNCQCSSSQVCCSKECKNKGTDPRPLDEQGDNCSCPDKTSCSHRETKPASEGCQISDVGMSEDVHEEKSDTLWPCKFCPKRLPSLALHRKHELMHRNLKPFKCQYCPKLFAQLYSCRVHERTHSEEKPWSCTYCGRMFADEECCKKHEYLHTQKPFRCRFCEKSYTARSKLLAHERIHTGTSLHSCQFCGKLFPDRSHCKNHERTHTGEKPFKCSQCDKKFSNRSCLNKHESIHTVGTPYKCRYCEKCFKTPTAIRKHEHNHTLSARFKCCYCHKSFKLKQSLQAHERCHTGEKPFPCRHCDKRFSGLTARSAHERIHTGELPYKCKYCNRLFRHSNSLTRHIRNHTGEKPYECSYCGAKFKDLKQKKVHERAHTGERPFVCLFCGKTFRDSSTMVKHERIHTGERPYKCAYCDETFAYYTTRKNHEQTHRKEEVTIAVTQ